MKFNYSVEVKELKEVHEIPDAWKKEDFLNLLDKIEYADKNSIPDDELKEMTALALSDLEPEQAAEVVLEMRLGDRLKKGQRQNIAEELKDDRLWEEYAEISMHEELFNVGCMINWAFPKVYPVPDIVLLRIKITSKNSESKSNLQNPSPSFLARLLSDGMNEHNTILRLFEENIKGNAFREAEDIIWKFQMAGFEPTDNSNEIIIFTSWNWIDELKGVKEFESQAYSDDQVDD